MKKTLALLLTLLLILGTLAGCGKTEKPGDDKEKDSEKATITFVHGYYHDESEWPAAAQMRQIYQDFADMHKDEFTFVASLMSPVQRASTTPRSTTLAAASSMTSPTLAAGTSSPSQVRLV